MQYSYPGEMSEAEAIAYVDRAKRKFGESNIRHVGIELSGDSNVEITVSLFEGARERIRRLSPAMVDALQKGA